MRDFQKELEWPLSDLRLLGLRQPFFFFSKARWGGMGPGAGADEGLANKTFLEATWPGDRGGYR